MRMTKHFGSNSGQTIPQPYKMYLRWYHLVKYVRFEEIIQQI